MTSVLTHAEHLRSLLPRGRAWATAGDSVLQRLLEGLAAELVQIDAAADLLLAESYPGTALHLLPDWERVTGLPDPCIGTLEDLEHRRQAVLARLSIVGGQSRAFYIGLAATLGYEVTIEEYRPARCGTAVCGDPINAGWVHAWTVHVDAAQEQADVRLECTLERYKPAHTALTFAYTPLCLPIADELGNVGHQQQVMGGGFKITASTSETIGLSIVLVDEKGLFGALAVTEGAVVVVDEEGSEGALDVEDGMPLTTEDGTEGTVDLHEQGGPSQTVEGVLRTHAGKVHVVDETGALGTMQLEICPDQQPFTLLVEDEGGDEGTIELDTEGLPFTTEEGE